MIFLKITEGCRMDWLKCCGHSKNNTKNKFKHPAGLKQKIDLFYYVNNNNNNNI